SGKEVRRITADELKQVVEVLSKLEEIVKVIQRRGIDFADFLSKRNSDGKLPLYRLVYDGEELFFHTPAQRDAFLKDQGILPEETAATTPAPANGDAKSNGDGQYHRLQKNVELHEVKDLDKV